MAEKTGPKSDKGFTDRELEIMAKAWTCMTEEPKVNYEKLAEALGMTNVRSASNAWATIKKKLTAINGESNGDGQNGTTPKATPKATPKRKKAATATAGADADDDEASPTKKTKATPKGKSKKSQAKVDDDAEDTSVKKEENSDDGETQEE